MLQQPNFQENAPVQNGECWYRVLTNARHITKDGSVQAQALKGRGTPIAINGKPWSHELSGRIISLSGDVAAIEADAQRRVMDARASYAVSSGSWS
jgi:hypothetical protein